MKITVDNDHIISTRHQGKGREMTTVIAPENDTGQRSFRQRIHKDTTTIGAAFFMAAGKKKNRKAGKVVQNISICLLVCFLPVFSSNHNPSPLTPLLFVGKAPARRPNSSKVSMAIQPWDPRSIEKSLTYNSICRRTTSGSIS